MDSKPIAFITGATSGIGKSTAEILASKYRLILCGRRRERLEELSNKLDTPCKILSFDIRDEKEANDSFDSLSTEWKEIDVLINNAGNAHGLDLIHEGSTKDWDAMLDINIKGLLYISRLITPGMVERQSGHIVNISSIAGLEVYTRGNVYCASKHAVDALTKGMRLDLNPYGIKVTSIDPGLVETEFSKVRFKGDESKASKVYENYTPLTPFDVAETIAFVLNRPKHVMIGDLLVLPTDQASSTVVNKKQQ